MSKNIGKIITQLTDRQHRTIFILARRLNQSLEDLHSIAQVLCHKEHLHDLTKKDAIKIINYQKRRLGAMLGDPIDLVLKGINPCNG